MVSVSFSFGKGDVEFSIVWKEKKNILFLSLNVNLKFLLKINKLIKIIYNFEFKK